MATSRLEILQTMVSQNPADSFSRYGLAMEYAKTGALELALDQFVQLLDRNPNYLAGYFHGGQALEKLGRIDEAKGLYRKGIEIAGAIGDEHTQNELQAALTMLE